jgi:hypothetical protein
MSAHDSQDGSGAYERSDATFKTIAWLAGGLVVCVTLVAFAMKLLFAALDPIDADTNRAAHPLAIESAPPPPNLQAQPQLELAEFRLRQAKILSSYGWVDREAGIVRIPIDRAMDLVAERGLPVHK